MTPGTVSRRRFLMWSAIMGTVGPADLLRRAAAAQGPDPALLEEIRKFYALPADRVLRCVRPPFPAARLRYYRADQPEQARLIPDGPQTIYLRWEGDKLQLFGMMFGAPGPTFTDLMETIAHVYPQEVEGDAELLKTSLAGDFVFRAGAKPERTAEALAGILREQFRLPARVAFREVGRKVWVARGRFRLTPLPGRERIEIYGKELAEPQFGGGGSGDLAECLGWVGMFINRRIVGEVQDPPAMMLSWHYNDRAGGATDAERVEQRDPDAVLQHLAEQTGLTLKEEMRKVRVLFLERG
jgi:hypothetical protein